MSDGGGSDIYVVDLPGPAGGGGGGGGGLSDDLRHFPDCLQELVDVTVMGQREFRRFVCARCGLPLAQEVARGPIVPTYRSTQH